MSIEKVRIGAVRVLGSEPSRVTCSPTTLTTIVAAATTASETGIAAATTHSHEDQRGDGQGNDRRASDWMMEVVAHRPER